MLRLSRFLFAWAFPCFLFVALSSSTDQEPMPGLFSIEMVDENNQDPSQISRQIELVQLELQGITIFNLGQLASLGVDRDLNARQVLLVFERDNGLRRQSEPVSVLSLQNGILHVDFDSGIKKNRINFSFGKRSYSQVLDLRIDGNRREFRITQYELDPSLPVKGRVVLPELVSSIPLSLIQFDLDDLAKEFERRGEKKADERDLLDDYQRKSKQLNSILRELMSNRGEILTKKSIRELIRKYPALKLSFDALVETIKSSALDTESNSLESKSLEDLELLFFGLVPGSPALFDVMGSSYLGQSVDGERAFQPLRYRLMKLIDLYSFLLLEAQNHFLSGYDIKGKGRLIQAFRVYLEIFVALGKNQGDLSELKNQHGVLSMLGGIASSAVLFSGLAHFGLADQLIPVGISTVPFVAGLIDGAAAIDSATNDDYRKESPKPHFWTFPGLAKWNQRRKARNILEGILPTVAQYSLETINIALPNGMVPLDLSVIRDPHILGLPLSELVAGLIELSKKGKKPGEFNNPVRACVSLLRARLE